MSELGELEARVRADVAEGIFTVGAQVVVHQGDQTLLDLALGQDGLGRPTTNDTRFRVYCTGKPIVSVAVAKLIESGALDLDQPLESILPSYRCLEGGVTTRHILTHTAGLHVPDGRTVELTAPSERQRLLERQQRPGGWALGRQAAYSEHLGWWVLGALLESITEEPLIDHIRSTILEPLDLRSTTAGDDPRPLRGACARDGREPRPPCAEGVPDAVRTHRAGVLRDQPGPRHGHHRNRPGHLLSEGARGARRGAGSRASWRRDPRLPSPPMLARSCTTRSSAETAATAWDS